MQRARLAIDALADSKGLLCFAGSIKITVLAAEDYGHWVGLPLFVILSQAVPPGPLTAEFKLKKVRPSLLIVELAPGQTCGSP